MDPQQEIYTRLLSDMKAEWDVYDGFLPPDDTPYPFIYMADSQLIDSANKSAVFGHVHQTIHVWHNNPKRRGEVSGMLLAIKRICRGVGHTKNFSWSVANVNQRILNDNTTSQPLMHGVLEVEFLFS